MIAATQQLESYLESFSEFEKLAAGHSLPWLRQLRQEAFARFCQTGLPTTRDEDWRFTNVATIAQTPFRLDRQIRIRREDLPPGQLAVSAARLVFVNGRFAEDLSSFDDLPRTVEAGSLRGQIEKNSQPLEAHFGRYLNFQRDAFSALNTAFAEDGAYVHIRRGAALEKPIHLLFISVARGGSVMSHPRNLILAEEGSQAAIVEDYISLPSEGAGEPALCNTVTELVAADQAVISHYMIEREALNTFNISTLRIQQGRGANVASHSVLLGGALVRNNVHPVLAGEGAECLVNGLFIGGGRQHMDNYMMVEHASPHCASRQFYNGILDGHAQGVFHGRIIVHNAAQKTDAKQTNRNLLLSDDAQIHTKPQLEIYADDVKCTHGATIGQIEEDALFYLRSRGIDEASARKLLLSAFASECLERMKQDGVRKYIEQVLSHHLAGVGTLPAQGDRSEERGRSWEEIA